MRHFRFFLFIAVLAFSFFMFCGAKAWGDTDDLVFWGVLLIFNHITLWGIINNE